METHPAGSVATTVPIGNTVPAATGAGRRGSRLLLGRGGLLLGRGRRLGHTGSVSRGPDYDRSAPPDAKEGIRLVIVGLICSLTPHIVTILFGRYVLGMNPLILLDACAGAGTITAALRALQDEAQSKVPAIGYTVPYAIGNILLTAPDRPGIRPRGRDVAGRIDMGSGMTFPGGDDALDRRKPCPYGLSRQRGTDEIPLVGDATSRFPLAAPTAAPRGSGKRRP
jgi:hypothetical protein